MREIKFRSFSKVLGYMMPIMTMRELVESNGDTVDYEDLIIMQYTGLLDKNGVEIYEGDIVKSAGWVGADENLLTVQFTNSQWSFESDDYRVPAYNRCLDFEVIGNIYENKDLLEL